MTSESKQWYMFHSTKNSEANKAINSEVTRGVRMHRAINSVLEIPCRETQIEF